LQLKEVESLVLSIFPSFIVFPILFTLMVLHLATTGSVIIIFGIVKFVLPWQPLRLLINKVLNQLIAWYSIGNYLIINFGNDVEWQIDVDGELRQNGWYLIIANHKSWLDILVLFYFAFQRVPAPKFFLKRELLMMPFVGLGAWALDMPFMQRYSKAFLAKNPHLKGKDIETTRKSCEKFQDLPTSVINFVEGTRLTPQKLQKSSFNQLLNPRAGGIAFTLLAMGKLFDNILDVTLAYPENERQPMVDILKGRMKKIVIKVETLEVTPDLIGDYFEDDTFKAQFQEWLNKRWQRKDKLLQQIAEQANREV
jgi:1-acyl-sn-glycerol-3-phosphate acyltransferase